MKVVSYVLPYRSDQPPSPEFVSYVNGLSAVAEVLLVDGSRDDLFAALDAQCAPGVRHLRPDPDLAGLKNGKVRGVLTGMRAATHEHLVLADDDVRYTPDRLADVIAALRVADVVRPQNYFQPLPWHALMDTGRTLINRMTGGDWPGTLAVRRSTLLRAGGYDGNVLFENLELIRTIKAIGGTEWYRPDVFVLRRPPAAGHFWRQRVRQAYDEFARPLRLVAALAIVPLLAWCLLGRHWWWLSALTAGSILIAFCGRQRARGATVFPVTAVLLAPCWVVERGICAWLALAERFLKGGVSYHGRTLTIAANSSRTLMRRYQQREPVH
jgi:hypothetical protein